MTGLQTFTHPYLGIYTKCFLWQTDHFNIWIDSGLRGGWEPLLPLLSDRRHNVLLLTHGHWDHIGGVHLLREHGGTVYGHPADRPLLTDLECTGNFFSASFGRIFPSPLPGKVPSVLLWKHLRIWTSRWLREICCALINYAFGPGDTGAFPWQCLLSGGGSKTLFTGDTLMGNGFSAGHRRLRTSPAISPPWIGWKAYLLSGS